MKRADDRNDTEVFVLACSIGILKIGSEITFTMGDPGKRIADKAARAAWGYGLCFLFVGAAFGLSQAFLHFHLPLPFTSLALCAIAITFWYGGIRAGILAALLSAALRFFLFESGLPVISRLVYDLIFAVFAVLMIQATRARDELEVRVAERTAALSRANENLREESRRAEEEHEKLRKLEADLARIGRVTTMGELTASLAHELNQPIAAALMDANTCVSWLTRERPDTVEAREAASRVVTAAIRAADIIKRIRTMFTKGTTERVLVDLNDIIREMTRLLRNELTRNSVSIETTLAEDVPPILGDRVQLQQVMLNLIVNSIEAMKEADGRRELKIRTQRGDALDVLVSVSDTGVGLPQSLDKIFDAFFTTKIHGTGMGLRISRSIIESHGGRLWADVNSPRGASFYLTLPVPVQTTG